MYSNSLNKRRFFKTTSEVLPLPNLVEVQLNSYRWFIKEGLKELLDEISPIEDASKKLQLEIGDYYLRHLGIYAYRAGFIKQYVNMSPSGLEQIESLEQLRVLWHGEKIHVDIARHTPPVGIDTPEDLTRLLQNMYS